MRTKTKLFIVVLLVCLWSGLGPGTLSAFDLGPFGASCYLRNETYIRAWDGPDDLMQCRNEFNLELTYDKIAHTNFFLNLRPFYDTVYDWSNKGTGGNARYLRDGWAHNLGRNNGRDPLFREAYVDFNYKKVSVRLGRQIVAWGKSDGVYILDIINPVNLRNPSMWDEEDYKIPLWMLNLTYGFGPGDFQILWIFNKYQGNIGPGWLKISEGKYHDWTFNTVGLSNEIYSIIDDFGVSVNRKEPAWTLNNSKIGLRWSGMWNRINYTLNYFYTWSDYTDWPNTGNAATSWVFERRADRLSVFGFSLDRYFEPISGVTRLEWAYTKGQPFYLPDTNVQERDQIGYMLGYDRWVHTDWLVSFQVWQNFILNPDAKRNAYIGPGANEFDPNTLLPSNGMRDRSITNLTGYLSHDGFFMGDTGHWELSYVQNLDNGYEWLWTRFRYELNDIINLSIGASLYWGNEDDNLGQFRNNKCIFTEIKFGWK